MAPFADSNPSSTGLLDRLGLRFDGKSRRALTIALSVLPIVALANISILLWSFEGIDLS